MMYIVYKTTNLINKKFYIGVHLIGSSRCYYFGSGKLLKLAIKKYGKCNFIRETIKNNLTREEAFILERTLITSQCLNDDSCYNLAPGGRGGYVGKEAYDKISKSLRGRKFSKSHLEKLSKKNSGKNNAMFGKISPIRRKTLAINLITGVQISFLCRQRASDYTLVKPGNISTICKGLRSSAKNWTFKYYS